MAACRDIGIRGPGWQQCRDSVLKRGDRLDYSLHSNRPTFGITPRMENQMEKKLINYWDAGFIKRFIGILSRVYKEVYNDKTLSPSRSQYCP